MLKLMAQGKSNKEIGSALFISEGTVKSHVKAIFAKMNVISRTEAVANATRRGLIQLNARDRLSKFSAIGVGGRSSATPNNTGLARARPSIAGSRTAPLSQAYF